MRVPDKDTLCVYCGTDLEKRDAADLHIKRMEEAIRWALKVVNEVASELSDNPSLYCDNKSAWIMLEAELRKRSGVE